MRQANVTNPKKGQKRDQRDDLPLKTTSWGGEEACGEMLVLDSLLPPFAIPFMSLTWHCLSLGLIQHLDHVAISGLGQFL